MSAARVTVLTLVACAVALGGCSSNGDPARCLPASTALTATILGGAQPSAGSLTPIKASAVLSTEFKSVYLVAIRFKAAGVDEQTGVWAVNNLTSPGTTFAVDGFARQFTTWPSGPDSDAKITNQTDGFDASVSCLG